MSRPSPWNTERTTPAYKRGSSVPPELAENSEILSWWRSEHDELLMKLIAEYKWYWASFVKDRVLEITDKKKVEDWKDRRTGERVWYNEIRRFAQARAKQQGFLEDLDDPSLKPCEVCGEDFVEDAHPTAIIREFEGPKNVRFCPKCREPNFVEEGDAVDIDRFLIEFSKALGKVPSKSELKNWYVTLSEVDKESRVSLMKLWKHPIPRVSQVEQEYDSWFEALVDSGVLSSGAQETKFGTRCLAEDGHVCLSIGEKVIDDFLYDRGIEHEKEPDYPEQDYRADFRVGNVLIEFFGLEGRDEYDTKTEEKKRICEEQNIDLIELYSDDISDQQALKEKLSAIL
jgi:hypothetical protein